MNAEIESTTYKKWYKKFMIERATLPSDIQEMQKEQGGQWKEIDRLLPSLLDLSGIFKKAMIFKTVYNPGGVQSWSHLGWWIV